MNDVFFCQHKPAALIEIRGEDALDYLQSQFSNDLKGLTPASVTYGFWLSRKGKVVADSFIIQTEAESFLAYSYFSKTEVLRPKMEENIVADDVDFDDISSHYAVFSVWGAGAELFLSDLSLPLPANKTFFEQDGIFLFEGRRSQSQNFDLLVPLAQVDPFQAQVGTLKNKHRLAEVSEEQMETERIVSAIPAVPQDIGSGDLPQEGGVEQEGVSFNKGCYLGQEVMARLHAMGRPQRSLHQVKLSEAPPAIPCQLFLEDKVIGELRSYAWVEKEGVGLALLKDRSIAGHAHFSYEAKGETRVVLL